MPNLARKLKLYSAEWCADCRNAKRFLDEQGVDYELVEIDKDEQAARLLEERTGKRGIPCLLIDGDRWLRAYEPGRGFDREGVARELGL